MTQMIPTAVIIFLLFILLVCRTYLSLIKAYTYQSLVFATPRNYSLWHVIFSYDLGITFKLRRDKPQANPSCLSIWLGTFYQFELQLVQLPFVKEIKNGKLSLIILEPHVLHFINIDRIVARKPNQNIDAVASIATTYVLSLIN